MDAKLRKLRRNVQERLKSLMEDTFQTPPDDWAGFQKALGRYAELKIQLADVEQALQYDELSAEDD